MGASLKKVCFNNSIREKITSCLWGFAIMLSDFHTSLQTWFNARFAAPTDVQALAWPRIAAGEHVLATAPTGSGKTLTAFLWSLNQFATDRWRPGQTRVLYISPLKALNNDIQRNLLGPLKELRDDHQFPRLKVQTRSGDSTQSERQRMLRQPPDILITTPESLMLLLTTNRGRQALSSVETVILDEIHAVVDNRRGVQLMVSMERLARLAGEFQRIALSATVRPLREVATYVAGRDGDGVRRRVVVIDGGVDPSRRTKEIALRVRYPEDVRDAVANNRKIWDPLAKHFKSLIADNRATLLFTNSRRMAEKITLKINEDEPSPLAYAHHGSLARDIRTEVERRLKAGELKAIVATRSLEMGIDIGHLDEVVLVQSPPSIAAALQRIGRAGHGVGELSLGTLYPTHAQDLLEAAVLADAVGKRDIEPQSVMRNALDVLCQSIVSICADETWSADDLFVLVRSSAPYEGLPREQFDWVLELLAGRYAGARIRELQPRIALDRINGSVRAQKSAVLALYNAGGTIPDRGYYQLRHEDTGAVIGELDEEFVWEATTGQTFTLGTQKWQILRITHNDVIVRSSTAGAATTPFWRNEAFNRSFHFSERIGLFLEVAEGQFSAGREEAFQAALVGHHQFDETAAAELRQYLARQRRHTEAALPHRHHLLFEEVQSGPGGYQGPDAPKQLVIHTCWGGRLNRPWALALAAAWRTAFDTVPDIHADNNSIVIQLKTSVTVELLLGLVTPENLERHLRQSLERSGFFGARFRECAGRALLLTKRRFNQRLPLWMSRLQAKKLMTAVKKYQDFPLLLETWRTCLVDEFDLRALRSMLGELDSGRITWSSVRTATPSPFARNLAFDQISRHMYADDAPERDDVSALDDDLIWRAVNDESLRPRLKPDVIEAFEAKRQRRAEGYEPQDVEDWLEWAKERVLTPMDKWGFDLPHPHLVRFSSGGRAWVAHLELAAGLIGSGLCARLAGPDNPPAVEDLRSLADFVKEILSFYGPLTLARIETLLPPLPQEELLDLLESGVWVAGKLVAGSDERHFCDESNLEALLRYQRALSRADFVAKPVSEMPGFLAFWHGFGQSWSDVGGLTAIERLNGYRAPVACWLHDFMAARFDDFTDHLLDDLITRERIGWLGVGHRQITLCYAEDLSLHASESSLAPRAWLDGLFLDKQARYEFHQIGDRAGEDLTTFNERWWQAVWAGAIVADGLAPLRLGAMRKYQFGQVGASRRRRVRMAAQGWPGNWRLNEVPQVLDDPVEQMEETKERARVLLNRYGFLCREIVNREVRWASLFKALRIMELAGEVIAGYFFEGLSGPQFITPRALHPLRAQRPPKSFWMSAMDPASPCGLSLDWPQLPPRRLGNYLSFLADELALVVEGHGLKLRFLVPPDHKDMGAVTAPLRHIAMLRRRVRISTINGEPARNNPYLEALDRTMTRTTDHRHVFYEHR